MRSANAIMSELLDHFRNVHTHRRVKHAQAIKGDAEKLDPIPMEIPEFRPPTLREEMQKYIRMEVSRHASRMEQETFEEADDFELPDEDPDWFSPYEVSDMQDDAPIDGFLQETADGDQAVDNYLAKTEPNGNEDSAESPATGSPDEPPTKTD